MTEVPASVKDPNSARPLQLAPPVRTGFSRTRDAWLLLLALLAGAAVMVLEVAAPRLSAPHVGTTVLVWTAVISTFLGGLAWGNAWGGRLADRGRRFTLSFLFAAAAVTAALTLPLHALVMSATASWSHTVRVLVAIPLAFLPVSIALGTIPPALARDLLRSGPPGWRLGLVSASGALGSVAGTVLSGFVLVPSLGLRDLFLAVALALATAAALAPRSQGTSAVRPDPKEVVPVLPRGWAALAVIAGAAILAFEIVAGRLASEALGASIYTWTSVIGAVLVGMAGGAALGGYLADRFAPARLLRWLLLGASAAACSALWARGLLDRADSLAEQGYDWAIVTLLTTSAAFLLPAFVLGMLSPVVIRATLSDPASDGRVVGRLYALGTLGAVASTLVVGTVLIPLLGLERVLLLVAFVLAVASGLLRGRQPYVWHLGLVVLALLLHPPFPLAAQLAEHAGLADSLPDAHRTDSRYFRIRVREDMRRWVRLEAEPDLERLDTLDPNETAAWWDTDTFRLHWSRVEPMTVVERARLRQLVATPSDRAAIDAFYDIQRHDRRMLILDRLVHGYVDLDDPRWLGYEYERLYADVVQHLWPERDAVRCLFLGGGAFAFQRYLLASKDAGVELITAEIDPQVTETARRYLGLEANPRHVVVHEDARTYVERSPAGEARFDFVFGDAFNDLAVPFHLTTREFVEAMAARMTPKGVYLANVIDAWASGRFLDSMVRTLGTVFRHVAVVTTPPRRVHVRNTFVVLASHAPLRLGSLGPSEADGEPPVLYDRHDMEDLRRRAQGLVLTDDHAPVEILLAPVVRVR